MPGSPLEALEKVGKVEELGTALGVGEEDGDVGEATERQNHLADDVAVAGASVTGLGCHDDGRDPEDDEDGHVLLQRLGNLGDPSLLQIEQLLLRAPNLNRRRRWKR